MIRGEPRMRICLRSIAVAAVILCLAALVSCEIGDTVDGVTTEKIEFYTGDEHASADSQLSAAEEELYKRVKGYFDIYYDKAVYTTSFDPSERGEYGGDECYVFRSYTEDGSEGFLIAASVDGRSVYGSDNVRGLVALIWCEGWTEPDFSYFGEQDTSNL